MTCWGISWWFVIYGDETGSRADVAARDSDETRKDALRIFADMSRPYFSDQERAWTLYSGLTESVSKIRKKLETLRRARAFETLREAFEEFYCDNRVELDSMVCQEDPILSVLNGKQRLSLLSNLKHLINIYPIRSARLCVYRYLPLQLKMAYSAIFSNFKLVTVSQTAADFSPDLEILASLVISRDFITAEINPGTFDILKIISFKTSSPRIMAREEVFVDLSAGSHVTINCDVFAFIPKFQAAAVYVDGQVRLYQGSRRNFQVVLEIKEDPETLVQLFFFENFIGDGFYLFIRVNFETYFYSSIFKKLNSGDFDIFSAKFLTQDRAAMLRGGRQLLDERLTGFDFIDSDSEDSDFQEDFSEKIPADFRVSRADDGRLVIFKAPVIVIAESRK